MREAPGPVFAFSGCAPLGGEVARALARTEPSFERALATCDDAIVGELGWSLRTALLDIPDGETIADLPRNFPLVVAMQIGMLAVLRARGLEAAAVVGLSSGEVSSAFAAGMIDLRDALRIAAHGGRLMDEEARALRMALVWLSEHECEAHLAPYEGTVSVAGTAEPGVAIVSGTCSSIEALLSSLSARGTRTHRLPFPWGVHSPLLARARGEFEELIGRIDVRAPARPIMSTCLARWGGRPGDFALRHWWNMFRRPVRFSTAVTTMIDAGADRFVEVGPGSALTYLIPRLGARASTFEDTLAAARGMA